MPTSTPRLPLGRLPADTSRQALPLVVLSGVAVAGLMGAVACFWTRVAHGANPLLVPAALVMLACCVAQARIVATAYSAGRLRGGQPLFTLRFWPALWAGMFLLYLVALAIGPRPSIGVAWSAACFIWYTVLLLPLVASPSVLEGWRRWSQGRQPRRLTWLVYASIALVIGGELGLELVNSLSRHGQRRHVAQTLTATTATAGFRHDAVDIFDMADRELRDGHFRVALVGNDATLRGARQLDCLQRVQRALPGVEFRSIKTPHGWVSGLAPDFVEQLAECQPDLVVAIVAPGDDLAHEVPRPSWFDWRGFAAAQLIGADINEYVGGCDRFAGIAPHDHEAFLRAIAAELRPCRSPIEPSMTERWQQLFDALDVAAAACVEQRVPLAVLVVPCQLQVDAGLCRAVARRSGVAVDALDLELPQRRLAGYAAQRQLPLVDLLPQMRAARQNVFEPNTVVLSEEGSSVAAGAIGGWLESRYGGALSLAAQLSIAP